ncbi:MAG: hypothetical protein ACAI35_21165, partial [Candidatus Methylacidiphilales bacterium]
ADAPAPASVRLQDLGLSLTAEWRLSLSAPLPAGVGPPRFLLHNGKLEAVQLPPHSVRIADLDTE